MPVASASHGRASGGGHRRGGHRMDKREIAQGFRDRLRAILAEHSGGTAGFLRETGLDRSALSQFLDPASDRMPRAETLRRIAEARGVTTDWLLSLTNVREG